MIPLGVFIEGVVFREANLLGGGVWGTEEFCTVEVSVEFCRFDNMLVRVTTSFDAEGLLVT